MAFPATFFVRNFLPLIFKSARLNLNFIHTLFSHKIVCFVVGVKQILFVFLLFCVCQNINVVAIVLQINHRSTDFSMLSCVYIRQNTNVIETMCFLLSFSLAFPIFCVCKTKEELWYDAGKYPIIAFSR